MGELARPGSGSAFQPHCILRVYTELARSHLQPVCRRSALAPIFVRVSFAKASGSDGSGGGAELFRTARLPLPVVCLWMARKTKNFDGGFCCTSHCRTPTRVDFHAIGQRALPT